MRLFEKLVTNVFTPAQQNTSTHAKGIEKLKNIYLESDFNEFLLCCKKIVHTALKPDYKTENPFVDRMKQFVSSFCVVMQEHHLKNVDENTDSVFLLNMIAFLIEMSQVVSDSIRFRACEFISSIFESMTGYDLTVELCDNVQEAMLRSLEDKITVIRTQAAMALAPLQDVNDIHCPIITAFVNHMEFDPSSKVRQICVEKIVLKRENIPYLLESSRDIASNVKLAVYRRALKYPNHFKITHKQQLIRNSLNQGLNKSNLTSNYMVHEMLPAWLQFYEMNYIKLLSGLRLDSNWSDIEITTEVASFTLCALFTVRPTTEILNVLQFNDRKLLSVEELNWDTAIFWRIFLEHLRESKLDGGDDYFPQLPELCKYIEEYCKHSAEVINSSQSESNDGLQFKFVLTQLFTIVKSYEFLDLSFKKYANELIQYVLKTFNLDLEVITVIINTLTKTMPNINQESKFICDILTDLMHPTEFKVPAPPAPLPEKSVPPPACLNSTQQDYKIAQLKIKHHQLSFEIDKAVNNKDYAAATILQEKVKEISLELNELNRSLSFVQPESVHGDTVDDDDDGVAQLTNDPVIIKRVLLILAGFLTASKIQTLNDTLRTFKETFLDEMLHSDNLNIKIAAMRCLGLCCTIDEHTARLAIGSYCAIIMLYNQNVQYPPPQELMVISIGTIIDSILYFGTKLFATAPEQSIMSNSVNEEEQEVLSGGYSLSVIVRELLILLNDDDSKIQFVTGRGICNFILTSRLLSHAIISRLILKYVAPTGTEEDSIKLQQYIGVMLGRLPSIPNSSPHFLRAIIPVIKIINVAPQNNPLSCVDVDSTAKLLLDICGSYTEAEKLYRTVTEGLVKEILEKPNSPNNMSFTKMLLLVKFTPTDKEYLNELLEKFDDIKDSTVNAKVAANIVKINTKLTLLLEDKSIIAEAEADGEESQTGS